MTSRPVRRPDSRTTHAAVATADGTRPPAPRPPSVETLLAGERDEDPHAGVILVAVRLAPLVTLEGPADLADRISAELHGRWVRVFGSPHQMFTVGAWPAPEGWQPPE